MSNIQTKQIALEQVLADLEHDNMTADDRLNLAVLLDQAANDQLAQAEALEVQP